MVFVVKFYIAVTCFYTSHWGHDAAVLAPNKQPIPCTKKQHCGLNFKRQSIPCTNSALYRSSRRFLIHSRMVWFCLARELLEVQLDRCTKCLYRFLKQRRFYKLVALRWKCVYLSSLRESYPNPLLRSWKGLINVPHMYCTFCLIFWKRLISVPHLHCTFCNLVPSVFASQSLWKRVSSGVWSLEIWS